MGHKFIPPWYNIQARSNRSGEVFIYGDIGESWSEETITAKKLVDALGALDVDTLSVRINSIGGSVPDGLAIYNALRRHRAAVNVSIDGLAASIASLIAMAGDTIEMASNAMLMVHAPWSVAVGNAPKLREHADMLDRWAQAMAQSYVRPAGLDLAAALDLLTDGEDHWYSADEALALGLIDSVTAPLQLVASLDHSRFTPPAHLAPRGIHSEEATMNENQNVEISRSQRRRVAAQASVAEQAEAQRRAAIQDMSKPWSTRPEIVAVMRAAIADPLCRVEDARAMLLIELGRGSEPLGGAFCRSADDADEQSPRARLNVLAQSLAGRAMRAPLASGERRDLRNLSLSDMASECLQMRGEYTRGMSKDDLVRAAITHTSSDFKTLLGNTAGLVLRKAYESYPNGLKQAARETTAANFKAKTAVALSEAPTLEEVKEGAEYRFGTMTEGKEVYSLATFGKMFGISRQALVNDDLGAFADLAARFGRAAAETEAKLLATLLQSNAGAGPTMNDTVSLFHAATHKNLAGSGAAITVASLGAGFAAMRLQKGLDGVTPINCVPRFLIVPAAIETVARQYLTVINPAQSSNVNPFAGDLVLIVDPRLDAGSATAWYLAGDPGVIEGLEYAYLEGQEGPWVETQEGWKTDGIEVKARLDFGCGFIDWRSWYRNPGA